MSRTRLRPSPCCAQPGNGASFLSLVEKLTGEPLTANAWVKELQEPTEQKASSRLAALRCG